MNNPSAFPQSIAVSGAGDVYSSDENKSSAGMTLRDYFASKAMQGMLANGSGEHSYNDYKTYAEEAHKMADAMLAEREKKP
jgi:hypothetical protein